MYLWNASSGDISQLCQMDSQEEYVGAVSWIKEGNYLAVGTSGGEVQVCVFLFLFCFFGQGFGVGLKLTEGVLKCIDGLSTNMSIY